MHARMNGFTELSVAAATPLVDRGSNYVNGDWVWRADTKLSFPSPFRMDEAAVEAYLNEIKCPSLILLAKQGLYQDQLDLVKKRADAFP